jgi:multiple sugar transport system permease protein
VSPFRRHGRLRHTNMTRIMARLFIILAVIVVFFPIYWMLITSFKTDGEISEGPSYFPGLDFKPTLESWQWTLSIGESVGSTGQMTKGLRSDLIQRFVNSLIVAGGGSAVAVLLGNMAGYGLARHKYRFFWGRWKNNDITFWFLSQRMLPPAAVVIAFLMMYRKLHWLDNVWALALVYTVFGIPFAVWLMRDAYKQIPEELWESGAVDGASGWQMFRNIGLPLSLPGTIASFVFAFIFAWNEYLFALMLTFRNAETMPLLLSNQITALGIQWNRLSALTLVSLLPAVVVAFVLDKYLVRVTLEGGSKG